MTHSIEQVSWSPAQSCFYYVTLRYWVNVVHMGDTSSVPTQAAWWLWVYIVILKPGHIMWHEVPWDTPDDSVAVWFDEGAQDGKSRHLGLIGLLTAPGPLHLLFYLECSSPGSVLFPYCSHFLGKPSLTFLSNVALPLLLHSLSSYSGFIPGT